MTDYMPYPKPKADMKKGRSAKKTAMAPRGSQLSISGAMGKHQRTGSGMQGGGKGSKGSY